MQKPHKPVWRINKGIKPKDSTGAVIFHGEGEIFGNSDWGWGIFDKDQLEIYAYETTRTREAKYKRFKCDCLNGYELSGIDTVEPCEKCKGKRVYYKAEK